MSNALRIRFVHNVLKIIMLWVGFVSFALILVVNAILMESAHHACRLSTLTPLPLDQAKFVSYVQSLIA